MKFAFGLLTTPNYWCLHCPRRSAVDRDDPVQQKGRSIQQKESHHHRHRHHRHRQVPRSQICFEPQLLQARAQACSVEVEFAGLPLMVPAACGVEGYAELQEAH